MSRGARVVRVAAGSLIVVLLLAFAALLVPVYYHNYQFGRSLDEIALDGASLKSSDDGVRAAVLARAARFGLPVQAGQVRLRRSGGGLRIEVRYAVPVDLSLYTVDLHFNPSAGR